MVRLFSRRSTRQSATPPNWNTVWPTGTGTPTPAIRKAEVWDGGPSPAAVLPHPRLPSGLKSAAGGALGLAPRCAGCGPPLCSEVPLARPSPETSGAGAAESGGEGDLVFWQTKLSFLVNLSFTRILLLLFFLVFFLQTGEDSCTFFQEQATVGSRLYFSWKSFEVSTTHMSALVRRLPYCLIHHCILLLMREHFSLI